MEYYFVVCQKTMSTVFCGSKAECEAYMSKVNQDDYRWFDEATYRGDLWEIWHFLYIDMWKVVYALFKVKSSILRMAPTRSAADV